MRKITIVFVGALLCFACARKEENAGPVPMTQPQVPEAMEQVDKALAQELTEEDFRKGKSLRDIVMRSLMTGAEIKFSDYKGRKLIVDFWSSWCAPCIEMFPDIEKIKKDYEDGKETAKVLSISVDPIAANARKIVKKQGISFEALQAPVSLQEAGILLPFTVFADENGIVTETTNGKHSYAEIKKMAGL